MKFKKEEMVSITEDEYPAGFTAVEEGDWVQDYKYQHRETIFKFQDKFYSLNESRSGSPFTDWNYDSEYWPEELEVPEVVLEKVLCTKWKVVK